MGNRFYLTVQQVSVTVVDRQAWSTYVPFKKNQNQKLDPLEEEEEVEEDDDLQIEVLNKHQTNVFIFLRMRKVYSNTLVLLLLHISSIAECMP